MTKQIQKQVWICRFSSVFLKNSILGTCLFDHKKMYIKDHAAIILFRR